MIADYHIHTRLCRHAEGEPREYVERAVALGMDELGFADHLPFLGGWEPRHDLTDDWAMRLDELDDYCTTVLGLAREYASDVRVVLEHDGRRYTGQSVAPDITEAAAQAFLRAAALVAAGNPNPMVRETI